MKRLVIGVTGASGSIYAQRLITALAASPDVEAHLVFTRTARLVWAEEVGVPIQELGLPLYKPGDFTPAFASGSARFDGMVVIPCSAGTLGRIAHGISMDLVGRAADVMLKERRPLLLVLRESPYSLIHIRNMLTVTEAGATVLPASPSFYSRPKDMDELVDTVVARVLDQLDVENTLRPRWTGQLGGRHAVVKP
jgi:4-hydroxy-3-polyprenylbenzoate decarboxylase